jgi:UDP-glucose 4-epimerase
MNQNTISDENKLTVLITGAGGYIGSLVTKALINELQNKNSKIKKVIAIDVRDLNFKDSIQNDNLITMKADVRSHELKKIFLEHKPDIVAHLAAIVTPPKKSNREFEYSVDVLGTKNVLDACVEANTKKIIITSSGAAYGYHPDNPMWLKETDPLRGNPEYAYSDHKRLVEEMLQDYKTRYPNLKQLILRPGAVLGKSVKNQITALFEKPFVLGIKGSSSPFTFIWDQDVVDIILQGILSNVEGAFNLAGDGALTLKEIASLMKKPYIEISPKILKNALKILKKFNLTQYGPEQIIFLQYRPVMSNEKLKKEFPYIPKMTSKEVFLYYLKERNHEK